MNQLTMFGQNIKLLIGILACIGVAIIIGLVIVVAIRSVYSTHRQRTSLNRYAKSRRDAGGRPLPPTGMGVCRKCGAALPDIYFLPDGDRLCRECFNAQTTQP